MLIFLIETLFFFSNWSIAVYICSKVDGNRGTGCHLWIAVWPSRKSESVGFKCFKSLLTLISCSQSFHLEISLSSNRFFCWGGDTIRVSPHKYQFQYVAKGCTQFSQGHCTIQLDMLIPLYSPYRECSAFLQHWRWREATCFTRASFSFLQNWSSDSSLVKLTFKFLTSSVNLDIVLLVYFCILRNKLIGQGFESFFRVNTSHSFSQQ